MANNMVRKVRRKVLSRPATQYPMPASRPWAIAESNVASTTARLTFPNVLYRWKVIHVIDNTVALSKAVHGYAREPDMAAVVNSLHVCDAALGVEAWFEWVPTHANVSDLPSREPSTWDGEARAI